MRWAFWFPCLSLAAGTAVAASAPGQDRPLVAARTGLEQWVEARQLVSRTRSDWDSEKELLLQSKALFERELKGIEEQSGRLSTNSAQVDRERATAEREVAEADAVLAHGRTRVAELERRIRSLVPRLPAPLVDALKPLLARLPEESATSQAGVTDRLQTVVSLLNEIDKFNGAVAIHSEKRKNPEGLEISVETVYVGLGAAYFVNQTGDFAGIGKPGASGWEWTPQPELAAAVRETVRIYRGERTASFVPLPVTIQ